MIFLWYSWLQETHGSCWTVPLRVLTFFGTWFLVFFQHKTPPAFTVIRSSVVHANVITVVSPPAVIQTCNKPSPQPNNFCKNTKQNKTRLSEMCNIPTATYTNHHKMVWNDSIDHLWWLKLTGTTIIMVTGFEARSPVLHQDKTSRTRAVIRRTAGYTNVLAVVTQRTGIYT